MGELAAAIAMTHNPRIFWNWERADAESRASIGEIFRALRRRLADARPHRLIVHPLLLFHFAVVLDSRERYVREVVPQLAGLSNPFYDYYTRGRRERRGQ